MVEITVRFKIKLVSMEGTFGSIDPHELGASHMNVIQALTVSHNSFLWQDKFVCVGDLCDQPTTMDVPSGSRPLAVKVMDEQST